MDTKTLMMAFGWILLIFTWYSLWNLQGKIHCQFHTKDNNVIDRRIKVTDKVVKFNKGTYEINPKRFSIKWFKLWSIFPYPMLFQEWKWDTDQPVDPTTFKNSWDSPEARQAADSERDWRNMNGGLDTQLGNGKKSGSFEKYLPWIAIAGIVIVGFFVYQLNAKLGQVDYNVRSLFDLIRTLK